MSSPRALFVPDLAPSPVLVQFLPTVEKRPSTTAGTSRGTRRRQRARITSAVPRSRVASAVPRSQVVSAYTVRREPKPWRRAGQVTLFRNAWENGPSRAQQSSEVSGMFHPMDIKQQNRKKTTQSDSNPVHSGELRVITKDLFELESSAKCDSDTEDRVESSNQGRSTFSRKVTSKPRRKIALEPIGPVSKRLNSSAESYSWNHQRTSKVHIPQSKNRLRPVKQSPSDGNRKNAIGNQSPNPLSSTNRNDVDAIGGKEYKTNKSITFLRPRRRPQTTPNTYQQTRSQPRSPFAKSPSSQQQTRRTLRETAIRSPERNFSHSPKKVRRSKSPENRTSQEASNENNAVARAILSAKRTRERGLREMQLTHQILQGDFMKGPLGNSTIKRVLQNAIRRFEFSLFKFGFTTWLERTVEARITTNRQKLLKRCNLLLTRQVRRVHEKSLQHFFKFWAKSVFALKTREHDTASSTIQKWWRSCLSRAKGKIKLADMIKHRKRVHREQSMQIQTLLFAEHWVKHRAIAASISKQQAKVEKDATKRVQVMVRSRFARNRIRKLRNDVKITLTAMRLQNWWRILVSKWTINVLQRRQMNQMRHETSVVHDTIDLRNEAAKLVQQGIRAHWQRVQDWHEQRESKAIIQIQTFWRRANDTYTQHLQNQMVDKLILDGKEVTKVRCATKISSMIRMFLARAWLFRVQVLREHATIQIQQWYREASKETSTRQIEAVRDLIRAYQVFHAIKIQCSVRIWFAKSVKKTKELQREQQKEAAISIQCFARCYFARQRLFELFLRNHEVRERAAKEIQYWWKQVLSALLAYRYRRFCASQVIQKVFRLFYVRKRFMQLRNACIGLQCRIRVKIAIRKVSFVRTTRAASLLANSWRTYRARIAITIKQNQQHDEVKQVHTKLMNVLHVRKTSAIVIQKRIRICAAKRKLQQVRKIRDDRAAVVIQKYARRYLRLAQMERQKRNNAATVLQRWWRNVLAKLSLIRRFKARKIRMALELKSAIFLQKHVRKWQCEKMFKIHKTNVLQQNIMRVMELRHTRSKRETDLQFQYEAWLSGKFDEEMARGESEIIEKNNRQVEKQNEEYNRPWKSKFLTNSQLLYLREEQERELKEKQSWLPVRLMAPQLTISEQYDLPATLAEAHQLRRERQAHFYFNQVTQESSWHTPRGVAPPIGPEWFPFVYDRGEPSARWQSLPCQAHHRHDPASVTKSMETGIPTYEMIATHYCVDCHAVYCSSCAVAVHGPDTGSFSHHISLPLAQLANEEKSVCQVCDRRLAEGKCDTCGELMCDPCDRRRHGFHKDRHYVDDGGACLEQRLIGPSGTKVLNLDFVEHSNASQVQHAFHVFPPRYTRLPLGDNEVACSECAPLIPTLATTRCTSCDDTLCTACYQYIHRKGERKNHRYVLVEESSMWHRKYDVAKEEYYYHNNYTGEICWTKPRALMSPEERLADIRAEKTRKAYENSVSPETLLELEIDGLRKEAVGLEKWNAYHEEETAFVEKHVRLALASKSHNSAWAVAGISGEDKKKNGKKRNRTKKKKAIKSHSSNHISLEKHLEMLGGDDWTVPHAELAVQIAQGLTTDNRYDMRNSKREADRQFLNTLLLEHGLSLAVSKVRRVSYGQNMMEELEERRMKQRQQHQIETSSKLTKEELESRVSKLRRVYGKDDTIELGRICKEAGISFGSHVKRTEDRLDRLEALPLLAQWLHEKEVKEAAVQREEDAKAEDIMRIRRYREQFAQRKQQELKALEEQNPTKGKPKSGGMKAIEEDNHNSEGEKNIESSLTETKGATSKGQTVDAAASKKRKNTKVKKTKKKKGKVVE